MFLFFYTQKKIDDVGWYLTRRSHIEGPWLKSREEGEMEEEEEEEEEEERDREGVG